MTSRDHFEDSGTSEDEGQYKEDQSSWRGILETSEPPAIVLEKPIEVTAQQRHSLGSKQGLFKHSSQEEARLVAGMATADNRHSLVPEIPERTTGTNPRNRYR